MVVIARGATSSRRRAAARHLEHREGGVGIGGRNAAHELALDAAVGFLAGEVLEVAEIGQGHEERALRAEAVEGRHRQEGRGDVDRPDLGARDRAAVLGDDATAEAAERRQRDGAEIDGLSRARCGLEGKEGGMPTANAGVEGEQGSRPDPGDAEAPVLVAPGFAHREARFARAGSGGVTDAAQGDHGVEAEHAHALVRGRAALGQDQAASDAAEGGENRRWLTGIAGGDRRIIGRDREGRRGDRRGRALAIRDRRFPGDGRKLSDATPETSGAASPPRNEIPTNTATRTTAILIVAFIARSTPPLPTTSDISTAAALDDGRSSGVSPSIQERRSPPCWTSRRSRSMARPRLRRVATVARGMPRRWAIRRGGSPSK